MSGSSFRSSFSMSRPQACQPVAGGTASTMDSRYSRWESKTSLSKGGRARPRSSSPVCSAWICSPVTSSWRSMSTSGRIVRNLLQQRAQDAEAAGGGEADAQQARAARGDAAGGDRGAVGERQQPPGLVQEGRAGGRQLNLPVVAFQQFRADAPLQFLDLPAQRRLGHVQPFGRAAEVEFLRDGDESGQLVKGKHDAFRVSLDAYLGLDMHHSGSLHSIQRTGSDPVHMTSGALAPHCQRGVPMMHFPIAPHRTRCGLRRHAAGADRLRQRRRPAAPDSAKYPSGPVNLTVGQAPGGSTDLIARAISEGASKTLGAADARGQQARRQRRPGHQGSGGQAGRRPEPGPAQRLPDHHHSAGRHRGRSREHR